MEQVRRMSIFQLLGVGSFIPFCQRIDGEEREDADDRVRLVGSHCNHTFLALDRH
jgi:hypothetical protein